MAEKKINKYAVIRTGGKQYLVYEGEYLSVEKLDIEAGEKFEIKDVLLVIDGDKVSIGQPILSDSKVLATVDEQYRDAKKIVFKYKKRKNYRVKNGHRQSLTKITINKIESP
ncbi:MAG: 50S ribosomal protein L21 [bacterium]